MRVQEHNNQGFLLNVFKVIKTFNMGNGEIDAVFLSSWTTDGAPGGLSPPTLHLHPWISHMWEARQVTPLAFQH